VSEILWVRVRVAQVVVDQYRGLSGQFKTLAAFVASHQVVQANHVGRGLGKLAAVLFAGSPREFPFLAAHLPAPPRLKLPAATWADQLDLAGLFFFRIKAAFVHPSSTFFPTRIGPL